MKIFLTIGCLLICFAGCTGAEEAAPVLSMPPVSSAASAPVTAAASEPAAIAAQKGALPLENAYIAARADEIAAGLSCGEPVEEIRAAYCHIIENTYFADPVGLDSWRWHSVPGTPAPPYVESRAVSPLCYGVGSCEDFAAALTVLLSRMGYQAAYVSGLTLSVDGRFIDHAWTVVQLDGVWYHLDPQLEQNVIRDGLLTYRYFLKDDSYMLADHRWGENLAAYWSGALTPEQSETLLQTIGNVPACPESYAPAPAPHQIDLPARPDAGALQKTIDRQRQAFIDAYGQPAPCELNTTPPIYSFLPEENRSW